MSEDSNSIIDLPVVTRIAGNRTITEPAEQLVCPVCEGAFELGVEELELDSELAVDCPECEAPLEIRPYALISLNPINFTPTQDVADFLDGYENKTAVLNAAVRLLKQAMEEQGNDA